MSENSLQEESILSFYHAGSRDSARVFRGGSKHPDSLRHLTAPFTPFLSTLASAMPFLVSLPLFPELTWPRFSGLRPVPVSLTMSVLSVSCFPWRGLSFPALRIYPGCDSPKSALGAPLNPPLPGSTHQLTPGSQPPPQQLQEFKLLSIEDSGEKCFHTCAKHPGPGEWVCIVSPHPTPPHPAPAPPCGSTLSARWPGPQEPHLKLMPISK